MSKYQAYDESLYQVGSRKTAAARKPAARVSPATARRRAILAELSEPKPAELLARAKRNIALAKRLRAQGRHIPAEMLVSARRDLGNYERRQRGLPSTTAAALGIRTPERRAE